MKPLVKRILCIALTAMFTFGMMFTLGACDVIEEIFVDYIQRDNNPDDDSDDDSEQLPQVDIESSDELNKLMSADEAVQKSLHSKTVKDSWYDDEGNYNYIVYLGRINKFLLHRVYSFQYTKNSKAFGDPSIKLTEATVESVRSVYTKTVQKSTYKTVENSMKVGLDLSSTFSELLGESVKASMENQLKEVFQTSCTETNFNAYTTFAYTAKETVREFKLDYSKCTEDETYSYCIVTDVDVYAAICYNPDKKSVNYDYYTDAVGTVRDIVFSSKDEYFDSDKGSFEYDFSDFSFEKPEKYISNHEPITIRYVGPERIEIPILNTWWQRITFDDQEQGDGTTIPYLTYLKNRGYNKVDVKICFYFVQETNEKWHFYLCPTKDSEYPLRKDEGGRPGTVELFYKDIDINSFTDYNNIYLIIESEHVWSGLHITALTAEFTFHQ